MLVVAGLLGLLETGKALELRASKGCRSTGLEGAPKQQLRRQQGGKLHIKSSARGSDTIYIGRGLLLLSHGLGVDGGDVAPSRMSVSEARDVRVESAMRETSIAVGGLRGVSEAVSGSTAIGGALANGSIEVLHTEQMRGDKRVPPSV